MLWFSGTEWHCRISHHHTRTALSLTEWCFIPMSPVALYTSDLRKWGDQNLCSFSGQNGTVCVCVCVCVWGVCVCVCVCVCMCVCVRVLCMCLCILLTLVVIFWPYWTLLKTECFCCSVHVIVALVMSNWNTGRKAKHGEAHMKKASVTLTIYKISIKSNWCL